MTAAFRAGAATLLVFAAVSYGPALLGQRGSAVPGAPAPPDGGQASPRGGGGAGGGRGLGQFFRGRGELPTGTGVIRGRVTSDTGIAVRRAQVRASVMGMPGGRVASTDAEGRFELRDLAAGQWSLSASKPGYVTQRLGQRRPFETVSPIQLTDGQRVDGANFALLRGGVINGRVQDDLGDPIANVRVRVQRSQMFEGQRRMVNVGVDDETDDTGAFRLFGLAPGDYYVSATLRASPLDSGDSTGYAATYYPGTGNVAEAERVSVGAGEEMTIGFSLLPVRLVRISGTAVGSNGEPTGGNVILSSANTAGGEGPINTMGGGIQANGAFMIANVAPGSDVLNARTGFGGRGRNGGSGETEIGSLPIVVGDSDLTGVTITLTRGASIAGTIGTEGTAPLTLSTLRVAARPLRNSFGPAGIPSAVSAAGAFQLSALSGAVALRIDNLPSQWTVKSVVVGNTDVTDGGFELRGTEQLTNARIVLTDKVSEVNGTATLRNQEAKGYSVIVFAEEAPLWTFPTRYVKMARADAQGRFSLRGLPGGTTYLMAAVDTLDEGEWQDPEFLERLRDAASRLTLRDGETKTVALKLIER